MCFDASPKIMKYDTVFFFGIIHHLLRLGIEKGILYSFDELFQRISKIAAYGVIIEFSMPREASLTLPEREPYSKAFTQDAFEEAHAMAHAMAIQRYDELRPKDLGKIITNFIFRRGAVVKELVNPLSDPDGAPAKYSRVKGLLSYSSSKSQIHILYN